MIVLARIRQDLGSPAYLTTAYMGEIGSDWTPGDDRFTLTKTCMIYEELNYILDPKTQQPKDSVINVKYLTNSLITNGSLQLKDDDFIFVREVDESDELMKGYNSSLEAFRLEKAGLATATTIPASAARMARQPAPKMV